MGQSVPRRICINGRFLTQAITGVQRYAIEVTRCLDDMLDSGAIDRARYSIELLAPRRGLRREMPLRAIRFRQVGRLSGHLWEQLELPSHTNGALLFCPANTAPILRSRSRTNVVTIHGLNYIFVPYSYSARFRLYYSFLIPRVLRTAREIIAVSETERQLMIRRFINELPRVHVIQNGSLPSDFSPDAETPPPPEAAGRRYALYVGSINRHKNPQSAVRAIEILGREMDIGLVLVGDSSGNFRKAGLQIPEHIRDKVSFAGRIEDTARLVALYRAAACFVFPSLYEASPLPPLEAMACGCPVVTADFAEMRERCGDAAVYCDPTSADSIAAAMKEVIGNSSLRSKLVQAGLYRAREMSWQRCAAKTFEVLDRALPA
ncbi:MAG: glycosyltransferase family 1 protein [Candidatus Binataceae bacterium]